LKLLLLGRPDNAYAVLFREMATINYLNVININRDVFKVFGVPRRAPMFGKMPMFTR
jgi:hypothetical protein